MVLVARRENLLEDLAAKIKAAGGNVHIRKADVTDKEQVYVFSRLAALTNSR